MPVAMAMRAISGFRKRVRHRIASGGETFNHRKLAGWDYLVGYPILADQGEEATAHEDD